MPPRLTAKERARRERARALAREAEKARRSRERAKRRANLKASAAEISSILDGATEDQMRRFLAKEMARDATVLDRFSHGTGIARRRGTDYRPRIAALFSRADAQVESKGRADRVDFGGIMNAARTFEKAGDRDEAARIYIQLCDAISANIKASFDSGGRYEASYAKAVRMLGACAAGMDNGRRRRAILSKMVDICAKNDPENYDEEYEAALLGACTSVDDAKYVAGAIGRRLPRSKKLPADNMARYRAVTLLDLHGKALAVAGDVKGLARFAARHRRDTRMLHDLDARFKEAKDSGRPVTGISATIRG